jgi:hypothetical protein
MHMCCQRHKDQQPRRGTHMCKHCRRWFCLVHWNLHQALWRSYWKEVDQQSVGSVGFVKEVMHGNSKDCRMV